MGAIPIAGWSSNECEESIPGEYEAMLGVCGVKEGYAGLLDMLAYKPKPVYEGETGE